ncbi:MAG: peptide ABC transporter substrate-binding protein [Spirochaetaceae bacterium]|jgi:oligopeptide transport system substrate-binding protein|nr:peptide ABC transporter substrate-binding protein [Spirochaetaceae bacterium]
MKKKTAFVCLVLLLTLGFLSCGKSGGNETTQTQTAPTQITLVFGSEPNTIDPALNSAVDGAIYLSHAFEGLYKYVDNGQGRAQAAPGQAAGAPQKTVNPDGTVVYVYTLRDNLKWSDGKALTAADFVYTWQRLVDPTTAADYSYMIDMVQNANEIMAGEKDKSELGIRALNDKTLEVSLTYDCPFFDEIACFPATFPVRQDVIEQAGDQWTFSPSTYISNGPYRLTEWVHNSYLLFEKNPNYYAPVAEGPDNLRFALMDDDNAMLAGFKSGELDFIEQVPVDEIPALLASGELKIADYLGIYYVSINTQRPPFTDARVRKAFTLAIDRDYIINQITRTGEKPASGFVPAGTSDATPGSDFRRTGGDYYSVNPADYQKNVEEARRLLAEAGYPNGAGFPVVEYIYNTNDRHRAIAEALQDMWSTSLGITVTLSNQDWAVFLDTRKVGNYSIARDGWIGDYNDPINFLDMHVTGGGNNNSQYANREYDRLIAAAKGTAVQADRMRYLHQAEDLLVGADYAVGPIYFYTQPYMMNPALSGMYYTPLGYFFFTNVTGAK